MSNEQLVISRGVLRLLKPGGILVYSTCSLEREENEEVARRLVAELPALSLETEKNPLPIALIVTFSAILCGSPESLSELTSKD